MINAIRATFSYIYIFFKREVVKPSYYLPVLLAAIISYSFSMFNRTISMDDLARDLYFGTGNQKIKGFRWGQLIIQKLFSFVKITPFLEKFIGVLLLLCSAICLCCIFDYFRKDSKISKYKYTLISVLFVTYPLINEIWEYNEACIGVGFALSMVFFVCLLYCVNEKVDLMSTIVCSLLLSIVSAGYESAYASYITIVLIFVYLKSCKEKTNWFLEGIRFAIPFIIAFILRFVIGYTLLKLYNETYLPNGASTTKWFDNGFFYCIYEILLNIKKYCKFSLMYFPITEFIFGILVFLVALIRNLMNKRLDLAIIGFLIIVSIFSISIIQGTVLFFRIAYESFNVFLAFVVFIVIDVVDNINSRKLSIVFYLLMFFVGYRQSIYLHNLLALNNQRSDNEAYVINTIGYKLYSEFDNDKEVVFCGRYHLGEFIESQITIDENSLYCKLINSISGKDFSDYKAEFIETDVNSCINYSIIAFHSQDMMKEYLSYYGYDINVTNQYFNSKVNREYEKIAIENNMKPLSILDMGDYILVYFGKID